MYMLTLFRLIMWVVQSPAKSQFLLYHYIKAIRPLAEVIDYVKTTAELIPYMRCHSSTPYCEMHFLG